MPDAVERATDAVKRLYEGDPQRYRKLVVWVQTALKKTHGIEDIADVLEKVVELEARGQRPDPWWPYLTKMLENAWRRRSLEEHERFKRDMPNSMKAVLLEVLRGLEKEQKGG